MRIAICEDLPEDAARLREVLTHYLDINSLSADVDYFTSGEEFLAAFMPGKYHIIFMDIYMKEGGLTGMQTAEKVREADQEAAVILTTNSNEFGIPGYKVAVYYIVKPVEENEFAAAMGRCRTQVQQFAKTIEVMEDRQPVRIRLRDIYFIESLRRTCVFTLAAGEITAANLLIEGLIEKVGGFPFCQCHRSYIINLVHVKDMLEKDFLLKNDRKVPISKTYQAEAYRAFKEYVKAKMMGEPV